MKLIIFPTWIPHSPGQLEPKNLFTYFYSRIEEKSCPVSL